MALRSDMDALPVTMSSTPKDDPCSEVAGVSHACGHDGHMAMVLGAAALVAARHAVEPLKFRLRVLFQPSEEVLPGGALSMIAHGCLEGVTEVYGLHNDPSLPLGHIRCLEGATTACCALFDMTIKGRGGHASAPHRAKNPLSAAALMVLELERVVQRSLSPMRSAVLTVTQLHGGEVENAIPAMAKLGGVLRSFGAEEQAALQCGIKEIVGAIESMGYAVDCVWRLSYPSVINTAQGHRRVIRAAEALYGSKTDFRIEAVGDPPFWGEDFAYYLQHRPGAFFLLGGRPESKPHWPGLHAPDYRFQDAMLPVGAAMFALLWDQYSPFAEV
jgi:amidohydrolase